MKNEIVFGNNIKACNVKQQYKPIFKLIIHFTSNKKTIRNNGKKKVMIIDLENH